MVGYVMIGQTNNAKDWSGNDSCKFYMRDESDGSMKIDGEVATVTDAVNGELTYVWQAADLDTAGRYAAWFVVFWGASATIPEPTSSAEVLIKNPYDEMVT